MTGLSDHNGRNAHIAGLKASQVINYRPFLSGEDALTRSLVKRIRLGRITPRFVKWAREIKNANLKFGAMLEGGSKQVRAAFRAKKIGKAVRAHEKARTSGPRATRGVSRS